MNDLELEFRKKGDGGTVLSPGSNVKINALLYAYDMVIVVESKEELDKMIKNLERWLDKNLIEANVEKTKIAVLRDRGKRKEKVGNIKAMSWK